MGLARGLLLGCCVVVSFMVVVVTVLVVGQGLVAHKLLHFSNCNVAVHGREYFYTSVKIQFLFSLQACAHAMYTMIMEAEDVFVASFFLFQHDGESAHVVTQRLGDALLHRQSRPLRIIFVLDSLAWLCNTSTHPSVKCTLARWKAMGVRSETLQQVEWYFYSHAWYNNLHTKLACSDRGKTTLVWSGNVERCTTGLPGASRHENGVLIRNSGSLGEHAYQELQLCMARSRRRTFQVHEHAVVPPRMPYCAFGEEPTFTATKVRAIYSHLRPNLFWSYQRNAILTTRLGSLLKSATVSIDVCSPQVNDLYWWKCALESTTVDVRFLLEQRMDDAHSWLQKYLLGNRTNSQFYKDVVLTDNNSCVQWRTVDNPGLHSKFWIIDSKIVVVGSMNFTVFSAGTSSENALIIEDETCARHCAEQFQRYWETSSELSV